MSDKLRDKDADILRAEMWQAILEAGASIASASNFLAQVRIRAHELERRTPRKPEPMLAPARDAVDVPAELEAFDRLPDSAFVAPAIVRALFGGVSGETVMRYVSRGFIPPPLKFGTRNAWQVGALRAALMRLGK